MSVLNLALITLFLLSSGFQSTVKHLYINPTGTYDLVSKVKIRHGDIYGPIGQIQVKVLSRTKIIMVLSVSVGAPSYNSGALIDTLTYNSNFCIYQGHEWNRSCRITLKFNKIGITVNESEGYSDGGCGFGNGVFANGFYKKKSSKVPVLRDPQTGELIK